MLFELLLIEQQKLLNLELLNLYEALIIAGGLTILLVGLTLALAPAKDDREKGSSYECGFEPFEDARTNFNIHFYIVGILFLIFDLEIAFLYPWIFSTVYQGYFSNANLLALLLFLFILGFGFIYEWRKKALNWSPAP